MKRNKELKAMMFEQGVTEQALAVQTKIPRAYLSMAINGRLLLTSEEQGRIASALNVNVSEIFTNPER